MPFLAPRRFSWCTLVGAAGTNCNEGHSMKILLQHARTRLYFRGSGVWTANPHDAFDFQHSGRAADLARQNGLNGVQIAAKAFDCQFDEAFALPAIAPSVTLQGAIDS